MAGQLSLVRVEVMERHFLQEVTFRLTPGGCVGVRQLGQEGGNEAGTQNSMGRALDTRENML